MTDLPDPRRLEELLLGGELRYTSLSAIVFGTTVNLASRLTEMARPGTALVDAGLAAELRDDDAYALSRIARRRAHGLGLVQPYVLRRH